MAGYYHFTFLPYLTLSFVVVFFFDDFYVAELWDTLCLQLLVF